MRSTHILGVLAGLSALACVVSCNRTSATAPSAEDLQRASQPDFQSTPLDRTLQVAAESLRTRGFTEDGSVVRAFVVEHAAHIAEASMRTSACYVIAGASSSALTAMSLSVYDGDGLEVATAADPSSRVALRYCPAQSGTYYVSARAVRGSGLVTLRRFRGPTGIAVRTDDLFGRANAEPRQPSTP